MAPLDAARGLAMFGVCISHFGLGIRPREQALADQLWLVGMIASPTFIFLSGAVLGYLIAMRRESLALLRVQLFDRALFLLTVAHLAIIGAHIQHFHTLAGAAALLFMTDTIGVALVLGIMLVPVTQPRTRWIVAAGLYVAGWLLVLFWHPAEIGAHLFKEIVVGSTNQHSDIRFNFPLVPWFSVFFAATTLGERIAEARRAGALEAIGRRLMLAGPRWLVAALAVKCVYLLARPVAWTRPEDMPPLWRDLYELSTPFDKYPPGPTYLLAYGGIGVIIIGTVIIAAERGWWPRLLDAFAVVGRASLFVFVVQFYLYYLLVPVLPLPQRWLLIPYFVASVAMLWLSAWAWGRVRGNRFFTVGLRSVLKPATHSVESPAPSEAISERFA